jgi:hypothetical protein
MTYHNSAFVIGFIEGTSLFLLFYVRSFDLLCWLTLFLARVSIACLFFDEWSRDESMAKDSSNKNQDFQTH